MIRPLTSADQSVYAAFRRRLWPHHNSAGHWEALEVKYFLNPLRSLCPESGLYGYFQGEELCGTIGAYPMPVTLDGMVHAGHMIADYAVLHDLWFSPVAGRLWNELLQLPGRKFASNGSPLSQKPILNRGVKIRAVQAFGLICPLRAVSAKLFRLHYYCYPSPFLPGQLDSGEEVKMIDPGQVRPAVPPSSNKTAWIHHGPEFWESFCSARMYNGAIPIRIRSAGGEADLVITLWETGPAFRFATLLSAHLEPYTTTCAASVGQSLGRFLRRLNATILFATEADAELAKLVQKASWYVYRIPTHWWALPKNSDEFPTDRVSWWLTSAARDSHSGGLQPCTEA